MPEDESFLEREDKAGYNQSQYISELLGKLLAGYVTHLNIGEYDKAVKCVERIQDIISAKVKEVEIDQVDVLVDEIEKGLPIALHTYQNNGATYITNPQKRREIYKLIKKLFRFVNKLQDKYGYGMVSMDDPKFSVMRR